MLKHVLLGAALFGGLANMSLGYVSDRVLYPFSSAPWVPPGASTHMVDGTIPVTILKGRPDAPAIFYLQGNVGSRSYFHDVILAHHRAGYTVVTMQYAGSEGRNGPPSEERLKDEALKVLNAIPDLTGGVIDVHLHGYSLGSGIAAHLAAHGAAKSVVLQASYSSIGEIMRAKSGIPVRIFPSIDRWDNRALAPQINIPILILHGAQDETVPLDYAVRLQGALEIHGKDVSTIIYPDVAHIDFHKTDYMQSIHAFIEKN